MKTLTVAAVAAAFTGPAIASEHDNVLIIEVAGSASGTVEIELLPEVAPLHTARIMRLAAGGEYDGVVFHRVIDGFMAQTGDVQFGDWINDGRNGRVGTGSSSEPDLPAEFSDITFTKGIVGMARSRHPDSANSQFFIMFADAPSLDGQYTVVGKVISGQDVVDRIKKGSRSRNGMIDGDPDYMAEVRMKSAN